MSATQEKFFWHLGPEFFLIVSLIRNIDSVSCSQEESTSLFIFTVQINLCYGCHS